MSEKSEMGVGTAIIAFLVGSAIGIGTGILIAPKSGKETRTNIKRKTRDSVNKAGEKLQHGKDVAKSKIDDTVSKTKLIAAETKQAAKDAKDRVTEKS
jgi:gas vesicle protein